MDFNIDYNHMYTFIAAARITYNFTMTKFYSAGGFPYYECTRLRYTVNSIRDGNTWYNLNDYKTLLHNKYNIPTECLDSFINKIIPYSSVSVMETGSNYDYESRRLVSGDELYSGMQYTNTFKNKQFTIRKIKSDFINKINTIRNLTEGVYTINAELEIDRISLRNPNTGNGIFKTTTNSGLVDLGDSSSIQELTTVEDNIFQAMLTKDVFVNSFAISYFSGNAMSAKSFSEELYLKILSGSTILSNRTYLVEQIDNYKSMYSSNFRLTPYNPPAAQTYELEGLPYFVESIKTSSITNYTGYACYIIPPINNNTNELYYVYEYVTNSYNLSGCTVSCTMPEYIAPADSTFEIDIPVSITWTTTLTNALLLDFYVNDTYIRTVPSIPSDIQLHYEFETNRDRTTINVKYVLKYNPSSDILRQDMQFRSDSYTYTVVTNKQYDLVHYNPTGENFNIKIANSIVYLGNLNMHVNNSICTQGLAINSDDIRPDCIRIRSRKIEEDLALSNSYTNMIFTFGLDKNHTGKVYAITATEPPNNSVDTNNIPSYLTFIKKLYGYSNFTNLSISSVVYLFEIPSLENTLWSDVFSETFSNIYDYDGYFTT